jgi:hypothetical protein
MGGGMLAGGRIVGGSGEACLPGTSGGGAVIVGANNCLPQLRQKLSPGAAGAPHCGQTVAFRVGSLIANPRYPIDKSLIRQVDT